MQRTRGCCGRQQITQDDLRLIVELTHSAPTTERLFRELLITMERWRRHRLKTARLFKPTALKEMRTLEALGVYGQTN